MGSIWKGPETEEAKDFLIYRTLEIASMCYHETSVIYHYTPRDIPEEHRS